MNNIAQSNTSQAPPSSTPNWQSTMAGQSVPVTNGNSFASSMNGTYGTNLATGFPTGQPNLLAQQLAQQQAQQQQQQLVASLQQMTPQQQQAFMQARQAQAQAQLQAGAGLRPNGSMAPPPFPNQPRYEFANAQSSVQQPQYGAQSPSIPPQLSQGPSGQPAQPGAPLPFDVQAFMRAILAQGPMTQQRFAALPPQQQQIVSHFMRQRQQMQAQAQAQSQVQASQNQLQSGSNPTSQTSASSTSLQNNMAQLSGRSPSSASPAPGFPERPLTASGSNGSASLNSTSAAGGTNQSQPTSKGNTSPALSASSVGLGAASTTSAAQNPPSAFLRAIMDFYQKKGMQWPGAPTIEGKTIDLSMLYALVMRGGGFQRVHSAGQWNQIVQMLGFPAESPALQPETRCQAVASAYHSIIFPFETAFMQMRAQQQQQQAAQAARAAQQPGSLAINPLTNGTKPLTTSNGIPQPSGPMSTATGTSPPLPSSFAQSPNNPMSTVAARPPIPNGTSQQPQVQQYSSSAVPVGKASSLHQQSLVPTASPAQTKPNDRKGKGKAKEEATATPVPVELNSLNFDQAVDLKRNLTTENVPSVPTQPVRRKRQKIAYHPMTRVIDTHGSWELNGVEEGLQRSIATKRPRTAADLNVVDVFSLMMSLKSRLASEVALALNSLTVLSVSMKASPADSQGVPFSLANCSGLLEELVDLLEEAAFGPDSGDDALDDEDKSKGVAQPNGGNDSKAILVDVTNNTVTSGDDEYCSTRSRSLPTVEPRSYRELFRLVVQEEKELADGLGPISEPKSQLSKLADAGLSPLGGIETVLSITNLLRNLSVSDENARFMSHERWRVLNVLTRVASLPLQRKAVNESPSWPLRISASDLMAVRKDVLETINNFGLDIRLAELPSETASALFDLLLFFLRDANHHDQLYFDLSSAPSSAARILQPNNVQISHYLELGVAAFARVTVLDANRYVIARISGETGLFGLFESLIHLLPVNESDFQLVTTEPGLIFVENLAMSLYNLAFLAPLELKLRLREIPAFIKALLRVVRRLAGTTAQENAFVTLSDRCISTLQLLSDCGGVVNSGAGGGRDQSEMIWWGLSMSGSDEDKPAQATPSESDRATVKPRLPPKGSTRTNIPILSSETKALFEWLTMSTQLSVFGQLISMTNTSGSTNVATEED